MVHVCSPVREGLSCQNKTAILSSAFQCTHQAFHFISLHVQNKTLKEIIYNNCDDMWECHSRSRWPGTNVELYNGNWSLLFRSRAAMTPLSAPLHLDKIRILTDNAKYINNHNDGKAGLFFAEIMRSIAALNMTDAKHRATYFSTPDFKCLKMNIKWWVQERPDVVVGFVKQVKLESFGEPLPWHSQSIAAFMTFFASTCHLSVQQQLEALTSTMKF